MHLMTLPRFVDKILEPQPEAIIFTSIAGSCFESEDEVEHFSLVCIVFESEFGLTTFICL